MIEPDLEHNAKPENKDSENIYISGDNLDALKHLLKSYAGKVKCIYIDPPYNTGSDGFVYNDSFKFTPEELEKKLSIDYFYNNLFYLIYNFYSNNFCYDFYHALIYFLTLTYEVFGIYYDYENEILNVNESVILNNLFFYGVYGSDDGGMIFLCIYHYIHISFLNILISLMVPFLI